ncbi:Glycerophosphocholine phosphodiesterase [Basidiobolus ranarum]|uniref:Glycerophosphocholine phosphodiesterase n=1 Tax=Basidiobolus ranarum TaxID=34480 RepID=A0ABR2WSN5_9FUNG
MKFGKTLLRIQVPEWSRNYISYKGLKQVIKKIKKDRSSNPNFTVEDIFTEFSYALDRELEKVNGFYLYKRAEMERRMAILNEKYRQILLNDSQSSLPEEENEIGASFNDPEEESELLASLIETRNHMHKILRFGEVNKQGFFKILKKFDKKLSMNIKTSYLESKVELLPFACSPVLNDMLDKINDLVTHMKLRNEKNQQVKSTDETGKAIKSLISLDVETQLKNALHENNGPQLLEILNQIKQNSSVKRYGEDSYQYKKMATKLMYKICQLKAFDCLRVILENGLFDIESTKDVNERSLIHKLVINGGVLKSKEEIPFPESPNRKPQQDYFSLLKASSYIVRSPLLPPTAPSSPKPIDSSDDPTLLSIIFEYLPKNILYKHPDIFGRHPLHYATLNGYPKITECLVNCLLDTDLFVNGNGFRDDLWYDHEGFNPLFYAVINGHAEIVRMLIEGGHSKSTVADSTAVVVPPIPSDHVFGSGVVQSHLPTKPANNIYLQNPLAIACKLGHDNVVKVLLEHDIDVNLADDDGETPLHLAARDGYSNCIKLLVGLSNVTSENRIDGEGKHFDKRKVNLEAREKFNGWTPLFLAAIEGHLEVIDLLVKAGADKSAKDVNDWTPHEHAVYRGHHEAAKLIRTESADQITELSESLPKPNSESAKDSITETIIQVDRAYGHRFLQNQSVIVITLGTNDTRVTVPPVELKNSDISLISMVPSTSLSLVISASHVEGEPAYVDLPVRTLAADPIMFYTKSVDDVVLKFDVVPTYGSSKKIVGRATASVGSLRSASTRNRSSLGGSVSVPIVASDNLDVIGTVYFDFTIVKPFVHRNLVVGSQNTYWKSITTKVIGHRGLGANKKIAGQGHLQVGENTVLSFVTAASLGAEYIEFDVQLTRDHVPVIYHDWTITETGFDVPVNAITLKQFRGLRPDKVGLQFSNEDDKIRERKDAFREARHRGRSKSFHIPRSHSPDGYGSIFSASPENMKGNGLGTIQAPFATLEEVFTHVPKFIGFNIEVKYPMVDEVEGDMLWSNCDINEFVDHVLACVYDNVGERNIIFSSFHPDICLLLSLKQPNYPVFLLTDAGVTRMADTRCNSIEDAVRFAKYAGLLGIVTISDPILEAPKLIRTIKETGLLLFTYGSLNNDVVHVKRQKQYGVDAVIVDSVLAVRRSLSQA